MHIIKKIPIGIDATSIAMTDDHIVATTAMEDFCVVADINQTGKAALYELPWYMVIGNPAAGKSSAVLHSGLKFPFMEQTNKLSVKGVGGTRNCDWFFSTEGILLDTHSERSSS